ncbi:sugar phosphate isomerase/epimerase family protein [Caballeronia telluris]|uniref:Xylose isomerase domain-containing protein n=1 Tax=Caballeronia telluris TaxID=326475 RepID=A0A158HFY0_9BURK|nr:TIM barrel protein [Caballeronia telluris]SAL42919.1 xylose isomerase domain-containing protein [Caballeronia telluris]
MRESSEISVSELQSDQQAEVVIVASAFGADAIRRDGHAVWAAVAARAGASGFEVRRELFARYADATPDALRRLGEQIAALGLWAVYSTPATLFAADGSLDLAALKPAIDEAAALGARIVKLQLGGTEHGTATDAATLDRALSAIADSRARVVVENGQLKAGGTIGAFSALFDALPKDSRTLSMTFDTGNWLWAGENPAEAARRLAPHVSYVHCKAVTGEGARRFAVAPGARDVLFAHLLKLLPRDVPRGIEFPFDAAAPEADASAKVAWLAAA